MKKGRGLERAGTHRGHVSSEFPFALRMSGIAPLEKTSAPFLAEENSQCAFMASTESEDWTVEEDGEPAGEPVASTTSARATSSDREEEEEDDEEMAEQQQEEAALGSPEEVRVAAASEEDSDLVQTETTEGEDGYEAAEEDEQDTLDLGEEGEGEGERSGEVDSQVEAASAGEWDYGDGERDEAFVGEATPEPASPAPASPQGEGEGGGEALVTQRDEEIENYQSTVKELTAAVIEGTEDRCASIRIHRPFQLFPAYGSVCIVYYSFFLSFLKHL